MFIIKSNGYLLAVVLSVLFVAPAFASSKDSSIKEFLKDSEFGLQRTQNQEAALGKKGLYVESESKADISILIEVDLIDPFENKTIKGTKTDLEPLDDGIELELEDITFQENLEKLKISIDDYFAQIEMKKDINYVDLLNSLKITKIMSSPLNYVEIQGKKYNKEDTIKVKVNTITNKDDFEQMLNESNVTATSSEEIHILEGVKMNALERFNNLNSNKENSLNIINVLVKEISNAQVSFEINKNLYTIKKKF